MDKEDYVFVPLVQVDLIKAISLENTEKNCETSWNIIIYSSYNGHQTKDNPRFRRILYENPRESKYGFY
jgi:hypothetical protein